ncbi:hypothetical protein [Phreatobacter sp.]|uniref:hypothetical protein n=1 Tax=Phreatobacter sp. TaxID=1966341 RepID=UPI003F720D5A
MKTEAERDVEAALFESLYQLVLAALSRFGRHDGLNPGDYYVLGDYWGHPQVLVNANLRMLREDVIEALRELLARRPQWEIVFALWEPGTETSWPRMGLRIRRDEVLDGLRRSFLPEPYRSFTCRDLRPERQDEIPGP